MGKLKANGSIKGLVGNVVFVTKGEKTTVRGAVARRTDTSKIVKDERDNFGIVMSLITPYKRFIDIGFKYYKKDLSAYHSAISVNLANYREAFSSGVTNNLNWFNVSMGKLSGALNMSAKLVNGNTIEITWDGTEPGKSFRDDDIVIAYACIDYNTKKMRTVTGQQGITRSAGKVLIEKVNINESSTVDIFVFFKSAIEKTKTKLSENVSTSNWIELSR